MWSSLINTTTNCGLEGGQNIDYKITGYEENIEYQALYEFNMH